MKPAQESSLETLQDIRSIMERSARFISLSGWSGVWAGSMALLGSLLAYQWLQRSPATYYSSKGTIEASLTGEAYNTLVLKFVLLAAIVFVLALAGGVYFTWRKTSKQGGKVWNHASRRMILQIAIPMLTGGLFAMKFLFEHHVAFVAPTCLAFYGLALINGSKYTLSDIKYLGLCEVVLGCFSLFMPGYGLIFWALGFGVLHILYGIAMYNKYDKHIN